MIARFSLPLVLGLCAAVGASGFWFGRLSSSSSLPESAAGPNLRINGARQTPWKPGEARYVLVSSEGEDLKTACERILRETDRSKRQRLLDLFLETVNPEEYPLIIDYFLPHADSPKGLWMGALWRKWAEVDPKAAWAKLHEGTEAHQKQFAQSIMQGWVGYREDEALAFVDALPAGPRKKNLLRSTLRRLGESNPAKALARLSSIPSLDTPDNWAQIIGTISQSDPRKAIEFTLQIPMGEKRNRAIESIANRWNESDLFQAYSWVSQLPPDETRSRAQQSILSRWAQREPEKAADFFLKEYKTNPALKNSVGSVVNALAEKNIDQARGWVALLPEGEIRRNALQSLVSQWATTDPEKALAFALKEPPNSRYGSPVTAALSQWMRSEDPEKGMRWIEANIDALRPQDIQNLASNATHEDPTRALDLLSLLPEGEMQYRSIEYPARRLTAKDRAAAEEYMAQLPEGKVRERFMTGYITAIAEQSPAEAREKVLKLPSGEPKEDLMRQIAYSWARDEPLAAIDWISREGNEKNRTSNISNLVSQWASNDSASAAKWINAQPKGEMRDQITQSFIHSLSHTAPESAVQWAESIQDENRRKSTLQSVASTWKRNDPVRATEWISKTNRLPEDVKKNLLEQRN